MSNLERIPWNPRSLRVGGSVGFFFYASEISVLFSGRQGRYCSATVRLMGRLQVKFKNSDGIIRISVRE